MANYILKMLCPGNWQIHHNRKSVGFVREIRSGENQGKFVGRIGDEMVIQPTSRQAFEEVVKVRNRIALCGVNDREKALEVARKNQEERNAQVRKEVDEWNQAFGDFQGGILRATIRTRSRRFNV